MNWEFKSIKTDKEIICKKVISSLWDILIPRRIFRKKFSINLIVLCETIGQFYFVAVRRSQC
jgi:hypothetical protein